MEFGTVFATALIAVAILIVLAAVWAFVVGPRVRHYRHTQHQPWREGLSDAHRLLRKKPVPVGRSYFWEGDGDLSMRLSHYGRGGGSLMIQAPTESGGKETLVFKLEDGKEEATVFPIALPAFRPNGYALFVLRDLYWAACRRALVA